MIEDILTIEESEYYFNLSTKSGAQRHTGAEEENNQDQPKRGE